MTEQRGSTPDFSEGSTHPYYILATVKGPRIEGNVSFYVTAPDRDAAITKVRLSLRDTDIHISSIITAHRNRRESDV